MNKLTSLFSTTFVFSLLLMSSAQAITADASKTESASTLGSIIASQSEEHLARQASRNPQATLEFFGVEKGMSVVEALPGGGWYSKILLPFLGANGSLLGVDYAQNMWPNFSFSNDEFLKKRETWTTTWPEGAQEWRGDNGAPVSAAKFGSIPENQHGQYDAFLFIRALHNLARFSDKEPYLQNALKDAFNLLKPGGVLGIVQHQAREDRSDSWADGSNGYLKKSMLVKEVEAAGFEFVAESAVNNNDKDQAKEGDIVWRLPPSLSGSKDDADKKAKMQAIGESHRMTLKFVKPASN